ncbi:MAG: 5-formyltetrahydrofolate cyclo-ligase [Pseudomonadales bacterium]
MQITNPAIQNKALLRSEMRRRRRGLGKTQQYHAAQNLCRNLCRHSALWRAQHIACYLPFDGEIDTAPIIAELLRRKKKVYLPTLHGKRLRFARYNHSSAMQRNRFNISEPRADGEQLKPWAVQLIMLPLVAFDAKGRRLGMGAGFYDRTLAFSRYLPKLRKPVLMGLAHQSQQAAALASEEWDIDLDWVVTDDEALRCKSNRA